MRSRRFVRLASVAGTAAVLAAVAAVATAAVRAGSPPVSAALPTVTGTARDGDTLTATAGSWGGTLPISFVYEWQRCDKNGASCAAIGGATSTTYTAVSADVGNTLRVKVTASNTAGSAQAFSIATAAVAAKGNAPANTKSPVITGTLVEGQTLTGDRGNWSGTAPIAFAYVWQRCDATGNTCNYPPGAGSTHYVLGAADVGQRLRFHVQASNSVGSTGADSALTVTIAAKATAPVDVSPPVIVGTPSVGQTLTSSTGVWTGADASRYGYQWARCDRNGNNCSGIAGANAATYTVQQADANLSLRVRVDARNAVGSTSSTSAAVLITASDVIPIGGGLVSVPVTSLTPRPDHLIISGIQFSPSPFANPGGVFTARFRVFNENTNQVVRGALVYVVPIPYNWAPAPAEVVTGTDGWATLQIQTTKALPHSGAIVMQVRARAPGDTTSDILGGISTRRLVQLSLR